MEIVPKPVSGILDKIESKANFLGFALGSFGELTTISKVHTWNQDVITAAGTLFNYILNDPHLPNPQHVFSYAMSADSNFKPAAIAAIAGWILKSVDIVPFSYKIGSLVQKAGTSAAAAALLWDVLLHCGAAHSPVGGAGVMNTATMTPQMSFNVGGPNAPHASSTNGYRNTLSYESVVA